MIRRTIRGTIHLPPAVQLPPGASARVRVIDVSEADGEANVVAEQALEDVAAKAARGEPLTFELEADVDPRAAKSYAVSVHIDALGDGRLKTGDLINMQRYPLDTADAVQQVDVAVKKI